MHIPDGVLSAPVCAASAVLSAVAVGAAGSRSRALLGSRATAWMGVTAAFVFAAQTLNFPVASGTSGHLIGGVLAAALLGPSAAVIVMTSVLVLQCLVFADGGLLALGANALNMAVVQPVVGFAVVRALGGGARAGAARRITAVAFGSWVATVVAAAVCAGELALSRIVRPGPALTAMVGVHALVGLGEAGIAALVLATILRLRPELAEASSRDAPSGLAATAALGLAACLGIALFVSPFACSWPDGLERAVERLDIRPSEARFVVPALLPDYAVPGISAKWSTSLAAATGTLLAFALCGVLGVCLAPRPRTRAAAAGGAPVTRA
jgi:cobalt/nickel transport system permease protein